jgi:hypothetical protein
MITSFAFAPVTLLAATPALADGPLQGTATWLWDIATQDGDALVEPGETATVTLSLFMEPDANVNAIISAAIFDTIAANRSGQILGWEVLNCLDDLTGDLTTTDGVNLFNTTAGQLTVQYLTLDNPAEVFAFEWRPLEYVPQVESYTTDSGVKDEPHTVYVWEYIDHPGNAQPYLYPVAEAQISITVVPAPPAAILMLSALAATRRRSRR